ncbi:MAG: EAL domain-containing protein [Gammaproteobacteria bacterium]
MGSFRNRLLVLIIALVTVTQSVTLVAVLARVEGTVEDRAAEQLESGGNFIEQFLLFRATQLASGVGVLAADFGFREAFATGDRPTMLSAATNQMRRIDADLMLLLDTNGHLLASTSTVGAGTESALRQLVDTADMTSNRLHVMSLAGRSYQFFLAPVRAPDNIGWVAMGFAVDDVLAKRMSALVGAEISLVSAGTGRSPLVASTLNAADRHSLSVAQSRPLRGANSRRLSLGASEYLVASRRLPSNPDVVDVVVARPMHAVLTPYRDVRDAMLVIGTLALLLATGMGLLAGRSASRPIAALLQAARRIEEGRYDNPVAVRGATDFRQLASTFNAMQNGIAEREARITHLAYHDALTGLPNRAFGENHIDELLRNDSSTPLALILIDVRNLPEINATLGHHVGDEALKEVARRLGQNVGSADLVARLSAHQFIVAARPCSLQRAPLFAEQLTGTIRAGFQVAQVSLDMDAIAGVATFPDHGDNTRELLRCAQLALHDANDAKARVAIYVAGRDEEHRRRLTLLAELRFALEVGGLQLVYQPKVDMGTRTVKSVEALSRWTHPQLGVVSPAEFVPLAEQTGNSRRLTSWVVGAAIRQMEAWRREGLEVDVALNLSAADILDPYLGDEILRTLEAHRVPPTALVLEITESAVMRDPVLAARNMQLLQVSGVRFAIDDFGTGYSSLSQLSRLPFDELKIDRSLIQHAHERKDDATIVASTIELAHSMNLRVVAEGVENAESWNLLRRLGCDFAQGYLVSPPISPDQIPPFIRKANQLLQESDNTVRQIRALEELSTFRR